MNLTLRYYSVFPIKRNILAYSLCLIAVLIAGDMKAQAIGDTLFYDNFGKPGSEVQKRKVWPYMPTGYNTFVFAHPEAPNIQKPHDSWPEAKNIENNFYAVVCPKNIYSSIEYNPGYRIWTKLVETGDATPDDQGEGGALIINGGTTLASFYVRFADLQAGKYYRLSYQLFVENPGVKLAHQVISPSGNSVLAEQVSPDNGQNAKSKQWIPQEYWFHMPQESCHTGNYSIGIVNDNAQNNDNDFAIDELLFTAYDELPEGINLPANGIIQCPPNEPEAYSDILSDKEPGVVSFHILSNDRLANRESQATLENAEVVLLVPAGAVKDQWSERITVNEEGEWLYNKSTGILTFTPANGFTGNPTPLEYRIIEKSTGAISPLSSPAIVSIAYKGNPFAGMDEATMTGGKAVSIDILDNDKDETGKKPDPSGISITLINPFQPTIEKPGNTLEVEGEGSWVYDPSNGALSFTPQAGFTGSPTPISYRYSSNGKASNKTMVRVEASAPVIGLLIDASCVHCPITAVLENSDPEQHYFLFREGELKGAFTASEGVFSLTFRDDLASSGGYTYEVKTDEAGSSESLASASVQVFPKETRWKEQAVSTRWNEPANWDAGGKAMDYPIWCTDVILPGNAGKYPELEEGDAARDITLEHGASLGKSDRLHYRRAFVRLNPERDKWYMLSAPLKYMYSADYHADRSWGDGAGINPKIYLRQFGTQYTKEANGANPDKVCGMTVANISKSFANLKVPFETGRGFILSVSAGGLFPEKGFSFPRLNADGSEIEYAYHDNKTGEWISKEEAPLYKRPAGEPSNYFSPFRFGDEGQPARGKGYTSDEDWIKEHAANQRKDYTSEDNRYRFAFEGMSGLQLEGNTGDLVLLGNPYLSHIDLDALYAANSGKIENEFRLLKEIGTYETYISGSEGTSQQNCIAPMQSVVVKLASPSPTLSLSTCLKADSEVKLRQAQALEESLTIRISQQGKTNSSLLKFKPEASDSYVAQQEDIEKLFSFLPDNPEVYTLAGEIALEINVLGTNSSEKRIPLGIKAPAAGQLTINIEGIEHLRSYRQVELLDVVEQKRYKLNEQPVISFQKEKDEMLDGRFVLLLEGRSSSSIDNQDLSETIRVVVGNTGLLVVSPVADLHSINLFDTAGQLKHQVSGLQTREYRMQTELSPGIYLLQVKTGRETKQFKVKL